MISVAFISSGPVVRTGSATLARTRPRHLAAHEELVVWPPTSTTLPGLHGQTPHEELVGCDNIAGHEATATNHASEGMCIAKST